MRRPRTLRGYTLLEVVLASAILAVVLLGAQSAVVIASRALPNPNNGPGAILAAEGAMGSLADDLACASAIGTMTATALEFTVPDMTGDSAAETIRYEWSGVSGEPLKRTINGGAAQVVAVGVRDFALAYDTAQAALPTTYSEGAEIVLFDYAPSSGFVTWPVQSSKWLSQHFTPTLPASARSWSITRVGLWAQMNGGNSGRAKAQLRVSRSPSPGVSVLSEVMVLESSLGSNYAWVAVPFNFVAGLSPAQSVCFVLQWEADSDAFDVRIHDDQGAGGGTSLMTSADDGASWSTVSQRKLVMTVYGKVRTPDAVQYKSVVTGVRCRLRMGTTDASSLTQSWRLLNQPTAP